MASLFIVRWKDTGELISTNSETDFQVWIARDEAEEALSDEANNTDCQEDELEVVEFAEVMQEKTTISSCKPAQ